MSVRVATVLCGTKALNQSPGKSAAAAPVILAGPWKRRTAKRGVACLRPPSPCRGAAVQLVGGGGAGVGSHGSGGGGGIEVGGGGGLGDGARRSQVTSCGRCPGGIVEAAKGGGDPPRVGVGGVRP
jgi:hypothetical protein